MTRDDVDIFEKTKGQIDSLYEEVSILARKSPNDAVNAFKLRFVNTLLEQCNKLFGQKYTPFGDFQTFDMDSIPTNSDITFILSQYIECGEKLRADNISFDEFDGWYWKISDTRTRLKTAAPKKLGK
jgi:hypothetical protein